MDYEKIVVDTMVETAQKILKQKAENVRCIGEENSPLTVEDFTIIVGMAGQVTGQLIFGFSDETIKVIAKKMIEQDVEELDELAISAVAEFTNVLAGNATINLVDEGSKKLGISPPSIIMGKNMRVSTKVKPIRKFKITFKDIGDMVIHIALKEKEE